MSRDPLKWGYFQLYSSEYNPNQTQRLETI
jgi:hypothetical protein